MESRDNPETKPPKKNGTYRYFMLTYNNPPVDWRKTLTDLGADYTVGQLETGENNTPHIQAMLYYKTACRSTKFKGIPMWIQGITQTDARERVQKYVSKDDTRTDGPFTSGIQPKAIEPKIDHYAAALECIKTGRMEDIIPRILICNFSNLKSLLCYYSAPYTHTDVRGEWYVGISGSGKSRYARDMALEVEPGDYTIEPFIKDQTPFWDAYNRNYTVILDDLDKQGLHLGHDLKIWTDRYAFKAQVKHGYVQTCHRRFIVTSNYRIEELWAGDSDLIDSLLRRFKVIDFPRFFDIDPNI